jgi:hypothetical protein
MKYEIAEFLEMRFDMQPDVALRAAEGIVGLVSQSPTAQLIQAVKSIRTVAQRGTVGPPPSGASSDFQFIVELADAAIESAHASKPEKADC